ncbi:sulfurtransferase [Ponticaulis profundi]|uniref:Sulfurtransferase n=1 Tax=Ponticaulis profundi TaxID=2665222 RepID=A0ABW1SEB6_9PROT
MPIEDPMVSADWLKSHLESPDIRVIDASWIPPWSEASAPGAAKRLYSQAHIPGAVYFDIDDIADEDSSLPHMLPSPEKFSSRVRKLGLGDGHRLVVYDRSGFMASARVWWMFRVMGHSDIKVLDGGWQAWEASGGPVDDMPPIPGERHFTVRFQNQLLKNFTQVQQASSDEQTTILDARPEGRFSGKDPEPREGLSSGHIPGSFSTPATTLVDSSGCLKSKQELEDILGSHLSAPHLVTSCGSGVSAALILLALHRLGRDDAALYDGSWTDWASQPNPDIATA